MQMMGRKNVSEEYRYGFGGHEKDNEVKGDGNHLSFGDYGYDPRLGRRFGLDPISVPWESGYAAFRNNPIIFVDPDGKWPWDNANIRYAEYIKDRYYPGKYNQFCKWEQDGMKHAMIITDEGHVLYYLGTSENQRNGFVNTVEWFKSLEKRGAQTNAPNDGYDHFSKREVTGGLTVIVFMVSSAFLIEAAVAEVTIGKMVLSAIAWDISADSFLGLATTQGSVGIELAVAFGVEEKNLELAKNGKIGLSLAVGAIETIKGIMTKDPASVASGIIDFGDGLRGVVMKTILSDDKNNNQSTNKPSTTLEPGDD